MHLTGDSSINNKGRRACLTTFISKSILAAPMPEPTPENLSKADNDIQQIRSRISSTREEPSHQASLMAGNLIPGPSDVPCLVESSTARGDLFFWVTFSSIGVLKLSDVSSYVSNLVKNTQISPLPSLKLPDAPQNLPANPYGRHTQICFLPTKVKLGFQLVGSPKAGPISLLKPKYKRCNPKQNLLKPRSALKSFLSILSRFLCRLSKNIDRRHQLKRKSPVLLWKYKNSLRTLPLDSSRIISHEPKSLKKNGRMVSSLQTSWNNNEDPYHINGDTFMVINSSLASVYETLNLKSIYAILSLKLTSIALMVLYENQFGLSRRALTDVSLPAYILFDYALKDFEIDLIQRPQPGGVFYSLVLFKPSRTMFYYSWKTSRIKLRTVLLLDLKDPRRPSFPVMERTSAPPPSFMEKNRTRYLVAPLEIVSAINAAKNPFLTSQNLMIVTVSKIPEMFAEVSSTHHDLACGLLLFSFRLRDYGSIL